MLQRLVSLIVVFCLLEPLGVSLAAGRASDPAVDAYLQAGEYAHALKPVLIGSMQYDIYYITTDRKQIYTDGRLFTESFSDPVSRWEDQLGITGILVLSNGVQVRDEAKLFEVLMLSAAEVYTQWDIDETRPLPQEAVENIDKFYNEDFLRTVTFWEQEIEQLFKSEAECYATVLRAMLAADSSLGEDAQQMVTQMDQFAQGATTVEETVESIARFTQYSNNKVIREQLTQSLRDLLETWRGWQEAGKQQGWTGGVFGGYDLDIGGIRVNGQIGLDLLKLAVRFYQSQAASGERVEMLRAIADFARAHPGQVQMDPDLLAAIDVVIAEAESPSFSMVTTILEFARDKAVGSILSTLKDDIAKEWGHFAFKHWGTRLVGHYMAGAVSGIFLGYAISNVAFGLDGVYANTYNAHYAQLAHDDFGRLAHQIRTSIAQSTPYVDTTVVAPYRASYAFSKLAEIEFYKALAERSESAWSLKIVIDLFTGNSMSQGIEEARDYARITAKYLIPYWITPPLIERAVELAMARRGSGATSTVLVIDLSTSMRHDDPSGMTKIEAAKTAARQLTAQLGQDNALLGMSHEIAVVVFGDDAALASPFTLDTVALTAVIDRLDTMGNTNIGAGFDLANDLLRGEATGDSRYVVLMTDGAPNRGLTELDEFLTGPVADAEALGACVMTVGFGLGANEALLRGMARGSSCGAYYTAQNAFELRTVYAQAATEASGENVETLTGTVAQGETVLAGTYDVPRNQSVAVFQLMWAGSTLELQITNPAGNRVMPDGNRVQLFSDNPTVRRVLVSEPSPGTWTLGVVGVDVPDAVGEPFSIISSTIPSTSVPSSMSGLGLLFVLAVVAAAVVGVYAFSRGERGAVATTAFNAAAARGRSLASLVELRGPRAGTPIPLLDVFTIGRARNSSLRLSTPGVARRHAVIRYARGRYYLQDQGTRQGSYLNGQRVSASALSPGDRIMIGDSEFEFRID